MKKQLITTLLVSAASAVQTNAQEFVHAGDYTIPVSAITCITATHQEHPSSLSLLLEQDENISLFTAALKATGWMEALKCYTDDNYGWATEQDRIDSCTWTNNKLVRLVSSKEYDNIAYMEKRFIAHTLLIEPDEVLQTKYGITSLQDLLEYAHSAYDPIYPEDAAVADKTDPHNALNRFVAYHILPFKAGYYQLTPMDGDKLANNWNRGKWDIADWYETSMPHSLMKLSFPSSTQSGLYVNRRGVQSRADERGVFVRGAKVSSPTEMEGKGMGINGNFFYIDDIIAYDRTTQQVVLNERMRIDCTTLSPDFITSGARGHFPRNGARYGDSDYSSNYTNTRTCLGFKAEAAENFEFNDKETHLHVRNRSLWFWSYGGDEVNIQGPFDVKVKLPSLPAGKYELRLGTCVNFASRAVVQFYIDDAAVGVPVDMRLSSTELFGWKSDSELGSEEAIAADDQRIRNYGWMKGPDTYAPGERSFWDSEATTMRGTSTTVRKIIGTFETDGKTDHYLRMKNVLTDTSANELDFDYIELVPESVYANEEVPEDRH